MDRELTIVHTVVVCQPWCHLHSDGTVDLVE